MSARALLLPLLLVACGEKAPPAPPVPAAPPAPILVTTQGEALGSVIKIDVRCPVATDRAVCEAAGKAALAEIRRIESITDTWSNPEGDLGRVNARAGGDPVPVSGDTARMINAALTVSAASQGAFDITVGALSGLWDIPGASLPDAETIQQRMALVDWTRVELKDGNVRLADEGMSVILGGVVKGDAADRALDAIPAEFDVRLDVGTDFLVRGAWQVEVPLPGATPRIATFSVRDAALVTSGTWVPTGTPGEGYFKQVVDARSGEKAQGAAVSVVAHPRGVIADALSTTLRVTGADTTAVDVLGGWGVVFDAEGAPTEVGRRGAIVSDWTTRAITPPPPPAPAGSVAAPPPAAVDSAPAAPAPQDTPPAPAPK